MPASATSWPAGRSRPLSLGAHERPPALLIAVGVCILIAVAVLVGGLSVHDLSRHGGSLPGAIFLAAILALLALGMYRRRYLAVLGFRRCSPSRSLVTSLALVVASTILAAGACLLGIGLGEVACSGSSCALWAASRRANARTFDSVRPRWPRAPTTAS